MPGLPRTLTFWLLLSLIQAHPSFNESKHVFPLKPFSLQSLLTQKGFILLCSEPITAPSIVVGWRNLSCQALVLIVVNKTFAMEKVYCNKCLYLLLDPLTPLCRGQRKFTLLSYTQQKNLS